MYFLSRRSLVAAVGGVALTFPLAPWAWAETEAEAYPVNRVTIVVPFNPGGSADRMARAIASFLPYELGDIPVTVVNRPGGSGMLGHTWFLQQPDDGSTVLVSPVNPYLISNVLRSGGTLDWDAFEFVNGQWQDYYVLFVPNEQPFETADDLLDFISNNPGEASAAIIAGDGGHLSTLILLERLGLPLDAVSFITYDGGGPLRTALAGNQVTFSITAALGSDVIADSVRPLAVFQSEPREEWDAPLINDIMAERGLEEVPIIAADLRTFAVHRSFRENHPDRYEILVDAYRRMLEREDFQSFIAASAIDGMWMGPEQTQASLDESFEIFAQYIDILED
jgi:putative tricarboxylic transport membrane protein